MSGIKDFIVNDAIKAFTNNGDGEQLITILERYPEYMARPEISELLKNLIRKNVKLPANAPVTVTKKKLHRSYIKEVLIYMRCGDNQTDACRKVADKNATSYDNVYKIFSKYKSSPSGVMEAIVEIELASLRN